MTFVGDRERYTPENKYNYNDAIYQILLHDLNIYFAIFAYKKTETCMIEVGKFNTLEIVKILSFGAYLDGGEGKEILLPTRYVPKDAKVGSKVEAFIYHDNEGRIIATTQHPYAVVGEFKLMKVRTVSRAGAFLEWGIMKDLFVPFREQKSTMIEGHWYLVYVKLDHVSGRVMGSAKIEKYLDNVPPEYEHNQEVNLIVADETDLGYKVIINNTHTGLLYRNEIFQPLKRGEELKGYIKEVRDDEKIDVSLTPTGYQQKVGGISDLILTKLEEANGFIPVHDKSDPELIHEWFHCSKKAFKQAVGALYKRQAISLEPDGIRLINED